MEDKIAIRLGKIKSEKLEKLSMPDIPEFLLGTTDGKRQKNESKQLKRKS